MRSRYAAYAVGDLDHVFRTWHPRTRPDTLEPGPGAHLDRADVLDVVDGGPGDETGEVEFEATYDRGGSRAGGTSAAGSSAAGAGGSTSDGDVS